jgi:tol-pal system protein YbgF
MGGILPVALVAAGGCFASRQDVQTLQADLLTMRTEQARADTAHKRQLVQVATSLGFLSDSVRALSGRVVKGQGDIRGDLVTVEQELLQIQELTGQSQRRLQELRAGIEARSTPVPPPSSPFATTPAPSSSPTDTARSAYGQSGGTPPSGAMAAPSASGPTPGSPGPNELFQLALDQLRRGSTGAARSGFRDLLRQYPNADVAADAQFYLAETYANEGNMTAADSGYQAVVAKYPSSPRASTALYKHGVVLQAAGNAQAARAAFQDVVRLYPRSDESVLAKDRLRALK